MRVGTLKNAFKTGQEPLEKAFVRDLYGGFLGGLALF